MRVTFIMKQKKLMGLGTHMTLRLIGKNLIKIEFGA
jgi:hypothetical protein